MDATGLFHQRRRPDAEALHTNWFQANPSNYLATYYGIHTNYYFIDGFGYIHTNDVSGTGLTNLPLFGMTNQIPAFGITDIPVYVNGQFGYSSAGQRVLQLAANIFDASTNSFYPSVFRPLFKKDLYGNIFIVGYTNLNSGFGLNTVSTSGDTQLSIPFAAEYISTLSPGLTINLPSVDNIYGVPWIIGAKKGFPNFNEFSMQDVVQVTRLLQVTRPNTNSLPTATNQMYLFGITNSLGVEFWNSYTNGYSNQVQVVVNDSFSMQLALTNGTIPALPFNPNPSFFNLTPPPMSSFGMPFVYPSPENQCDVSAKFTV